MSLCSLDEGKLSFCRFCIMYPCDCIANVLFDFDLVDTSLHHLHAVVETNNLINTLAHCSNK